MIWITTPFLVALQYFSADQPIFTSFDRSPRNFCISLFILALAFPLLTWAFNSLYDLIDSVISRLIVKKKRNQEDLEGMLELFSVVEFVYTHTTASEPSLSRRTTNCFRCLV
jgi:hypothetical protein